mgnify:CR=1 FL=1
MELIIEEEREKELEWVGLLYVGANILSRAQRTGKRWHDSSSEEGEEDEKEEQEPEKLPVDDDNNGIISKEPQELAGEKI